MKTKIREGGRLVIPSEFRKALGLKPGDEVLLSLEDGEIKVISMRQAIEKSQSIVRRYIPEGMKLSEELIEERQEEASHA